MLIENLFLALYFYGNQPPQFEHSGNISYFNEFYCKVYVLIACTIYMVIIYLPGKCWHHMFDGDN